MHFPAYASSAVREASSARADAHVELGQVWRDGDHADRDRHLDRESGAAALITGQVLTTGVRARRLDARAVLERYLADGALDPQSLDGSFVVVIADPRRHSVLVCNDRLGTLPLYYCTLDDHTVAFAPEAKALYACGGLVPKLSTLGTVSFLNCGYCLGKTTLFESIHYLEPGSALTIDTGSASFDVRRYWKIVYAVAPELRTRRAAESALYDATRSAHEHSIADSRNGFDLMLSGGWDSRGILAFLDAIGALPRRALAWGRTHDVPLSDPYIAAQLAARFNVPFDFVRYDSDQLLDNAASWCRLSELANDNMGWYAEGASVLAQSYRTDADFALVGDEAWGWHGHPRDARAVRDANLPATLTAALAGCMIEEAAEAYGARYEAEIDHVLARCENDHPSDRRDFLYLHGRVARFIFALGYYKELAVEVRRPFLLAGVLDVVAGLPPRFRAEKNLYISMLGRYFPALAAIPVRAARSLPDWSRDIRVKPALRGFMLDLLDERRLDGVLGEVLDAGAFVQLRDSFFAEPAFKRRQSVRARTITGRLPLRLRQRVRASGWYPGSSSMKGAYTARSRVDVLRCIALIALLEQTLKSFVPAVPTGPATDARAIAAQL